jgi:peptidoglycan/LPS O-acetylase OafA/YrhL
VLVPAARSLAVVKFDASHLFFFQTPCRVDALILGALLAVMARDGTLKDSSVWIYRLGGLTGAILFAVFIHWRCLPARDPMMHSVGYSLLSITSAALLVFAITRPVESRMGTIFASPMLRFFGKYSYGLYVIHGMLSPMLAKWFPDRLLLDVTHSLAASVALCTFVRTAVCTLAAFVSWHLFEKRFLTLKRYFTKPQAFAAPASSAAS